jgi:Immunity protein family (Imm11)
MNYVIGEPEIGLNSCVLTTLQGVADDYELLKGISRSTEFPPDASFRMSNDFPKNLKLEDFLVNENKLLVISARVKSFLETLNLAGNEFLPVRIINHKGREVKEKYFIAHQVGLQDCIDARKSGAKPNAIDPTTFVYLRRLAIAQEQVEPGRKLFRMARYADIALFERSLADAIRAHGFSGISFLELSEWKGV